MMTEIRGSSVVSFPLTRLSVHCQPRLYNISRQVYARKRNIEMMINIIEIAGSLL
jgi:hypothetical protein